MATVAAASAVLVGIGLARFAFDPLQPALVSAGWFHSGGSARLASANLTGYLLGALIAAPLSRRIAARNLIRAAMLAIAVSFLVCAAEESPFGWFLGWRVVSGGAGGVIMTLAGPAVLAYAPKPRRDFIGQMIAYGMTGGILIAGAAMPLVLGTSVSLAWLMLGVISLLATVLTWRMWPPPLPVPPKAARKPEHAWLFCLQYSLVALGLVPHTIALVNYIASDLKLGVTVASRYFLVYGLGSLAGPLIYSFGAPRIGLRPMLKLGIAVQFIAVGLLLVSSSPAVLVTSSFLGGLGIPALIALFLLRSQVMTDGDPWRHRALWGAATVATAITQAIAAFGTSALIEQFGVGGLAYPVVFATASAALLIAFMLEFAIRR